MRSLVLAWAFAAVAADWPHVRGPQFDASSAETGLADRWPAEGPPVLWSRTLGTGYAAFVVADGKAFTLYQTSTGMYLTALDADTGADVWREYVDWPWQAGGMYPGPYATPTWYDGRLYYATPSGRVGCVEAATGRPVWEIDVRAKFGAKGTEFGFASTPLVEDGRLIIPVGGANAGMVALSAADGSTLWSSGNDPASYCPAYPITLEGRRLVVGFLQNTLVVHDPVTGERMWRERLSDHYDEHAAWPLFDGRDLMIASPFRVGSQLFRLNLDGGKLTAKTVWAGRQLSNDVSSSVRVGTEVYGFDLQQSQSSTHRPSRGAFKCLDFATGKVRWEADDIGQASAVVADGKLVLWTETGTLILARPNAERFEELARAKVLGGRDLYWAAPALSGKRMYVRGHDRAACVYLGSPSDLDPNRPAVAIDDANPPFEWSRLLPREPDFPNDAATPAEVGVWFAACVGILIVAGVVGAVSRSKRLGAAVAFTLGAVGTTAIGAFADTFVLTWPVSLYVAFRCVIALGSTKSAGRWWPRVVLVVFAAMCFGYFRLCLAVGYAMAWGFLAGFLPAVPFAVTAARSERQRVRLAAEAVGFAVYFWASGLLPGWKERW